MRDIGPEWRNLAEGLLRVEALEAQFRAEWGPRLEEARRERAEAEQLRIRGRGRAALIAASVLALLLLAVAFAVSLLFPLEPVAALTVLAILVPAVPAVYGVWALRHVPAPLPIPQTSPDGGGPRSPNALCRYDAPDPPCRRDATGTRARRPSSRALPASCPRSTSP